MSRMTLQDFGECFNPCSGKWRLEYFDRTHLKENTENDGFMPLGELDFLESLKDMEIDPADRLKLRGVFKIKLNTQESIKSNFKKHFPESNDVLLTQYSDRVYDELSQVFLRTGFLMPDVDPEILKEALQDQSFSERPKILFADTNSIKNGLLLWFIRSINPKNAWVVISNTTQLEIQRKGEEGKLKPEHPKKDGYKVLENRSLSLLSLYAEWKIRQRNPLEIISIPLEALGQILRGTSVLADRYILEEMRRFKRERHILGAELYIVTSDQRLASFLEVEGLGKGIVGFPPRLTTELALNSVVFDPFHRRFIGIPLHDLLWDLAITFTTIRLIDLETEQEVILSLYPHLRGDHRFYSDWKNWGLFIEEKPPEMISFPAIEDLSSIKKFYRPEKFAAKEIGLETLLDFIDEISQLDNITINDLKQKLKRTEWSIRSAIYIMEGIGFLVGAGDIYQKTELIGIFHDKWIEGNHYVLHEILKNYKPYSSIMELLCKKGTLPLRGEETQEQLRLIKVNIKAYEQIRNWSVYLGQAYLAPEEIVCGEHNPDLKDFKTYLYNSFGELGGHDLQIEASKIIDKVCRALHISPLKFEHLINEVAEMGLLRIEGHSAAGPGYIGKHRILNPKGKSDRFREIVLDGGLYLRKTPFKTLALRR